MSLHNDVESERVTANFTVLHELVVAVTTHVDQDGDSFPTVGTGEELFLQELGGVTIQHFLAQKVHFCLLEVKINA
jgi:hypothetical protein